MGTRCGRFTIAWDMIETLPKAAQAILQGCIVVRAESVFHIRAIEYVAIGDCFDVHDPGEQVPFYDVEIRDLVGGKYHVEFRRLTRLR